MKKIFCSFIIISIILSLFIPAFSSENTTAITFCNSDGKITSLTPNETITANVTLKETTISSSGLFLLTLYKNNKPEKLSVGVKETENEFKATLTLPNVDMEGYVLKATLWESLDSMRPLCSAALIPNSYKGLKYISINGKTLDTYDPSTFKYSAEVYMQDSISPKVVAPEMSGLTNVEIETTKKFPGKSVITSTDADGEKSVFTIDYNCNTPQNEFVLNLTYLGAKDGGYVDSSELEFNLNNESTFFKDDDKTVFHDVKEDVKNSAYIKLGTSFSDLPLAVKEKWEGTDMPWFSFELQRTAKVSLVSDKEISKFNSPDSEWKKEENKTFNKLNKKDGVHKEMSYSYSKLIPVETGFELVTIPNVSQADTEVCVVISFEYKEILHKLLKAQETISDVRYKGPTYDSGSATYYYDQPIYNGTLKDGNMLFNNYPELIAKNIHPSLESCDQIIMQSPSASKNPTFIKNAWGGSEIDWTTFKLHKTATVRLLANSGNINSLKNDGFTENILPSGENYINLFNKTWSTNTYWNTMYSKRFELANDTPIEIGIKNPSGQGNRWGYIILIDYSDNNIPEPPPKGVFNVAYVGTPVSNYDTAPVLKNNIQNGVVAYTNYSNIFISDMMTNLVGNDYIIMPNPIAGSAPAELKTAWGNKAMDWISFDIDRSATIKVITAGDIFANANIANYGFTKNTTTENNGYYLRRKNVQPSSSSYENMTAMFSKKIDIVNKQAQTVKIPNAAWFGTTKWGYIVIIDYD